MDKRNFESFMSAVKGKDLAEIRGAEVERILRELLTNEFSEVKETKFKVMLRKPETGGCGAVNKVDGRVCLWINPENWERDPDFSKESLKSLISHELLHVETGLDDDDPLFRLVAKKRGIDLWKRER